MHVNEQETTKKIISTTERNQHAGITNGNPKGKRTEKKQQHQQLQCVRMAVILVSLCVCIESEANRQKGDTKDTQVNDRARETEGEKHT